MSVTDFEIEEQIVSLRGNGLGYAAHVIESQRDQLKAIRKAYDDAPKSGSVSSFWWTVGAILGPPLPTRQKKR
jgi:hypothetical protein